MAIFAVANGLSITGISTIGEGLLLFLVVRRAGSLWTTGNGIFNSIGVGGMLLSLNPRVAPGVIHIEVLRTFTFLRGFAAGKEVEVEDEIEVEMADNQGL